MWIAIIWIVIGVAGWIAINVSEGWPKTWHGPTGWKQSLFVGLTICLVFGPILWGVIIYGIFLERYQDRSM